MVKDARSNGAQTPQNTLAVAEKGEKEEESEVTEIDVTEGRRTRGATCVVGEATLLVTVQTNIFIEIGEGQDLETEDPGQMREVGMVTEEAEEVQEVDPHVTTGTEGGITEGPPGVILEAATGRDLDPTNEELTGMIGKEATIAEGTNLTEKMSEAVETETETIGETANGTEIEEEEGAGLSLVATGEAATAPDPDLDPATETTREAREMAHHTIDQYQRTESPDPTRKGLGPMRDDLRLLVESRVTMTKSRTISLFPEVDPCMMGMELTSKKSLMRMGPIKTKK